MRKVWLFRVIPLKPTKSRKPKSLNVEVLSSIVNDYLDVKGLHGGAKNCEKIVRAVFQSMIKSLRAGEYVYIHGLGRFEVSTTKRGIANFKKMTGYTLKPRKYVRFIPCSGLKKSLVNPNGAQHDYHQP